MQQSDGKKYGFESVANMREKHIITEEIIYDMFKELSNMSRVDQYQINWMEPTTKAMVEFFQQLKDMNQDQGK